MRHALGKNPSTNHDLWQTFNDAGHAMMNCAEVAPWNHQWTWAREVTADIDIPADVETWELPEEFGQLVRVGYETVLAKSIVVVPVARLEELRQQTVTPSGVIYVAYPIYGGRLSRVAAPQNRAAVYPTQDDDVTDLRWTFQRQWIDLHDDDNDGIPNIPRQWERLLELMAQQFAKVAEDQEDDWLSPSIGQEIERMVAFDTGKSAPNIGPATYSVRRAAGRLPAERWFQRVSKS